MGQILLLPSTYNILDFMPPYFMGPRPSHPPGESICRARDWDATHRRGAVHLQPRDGGRQSSGGELGEEEGWPGRGGRWAERPPARSPAAGVVGGRRRPLGSGLPGLQWPPDLEEGFGGGSGPAVVAGWPAVGEAAREHRWPGGARPPVGGASGGGVKKAAQRRAWLVSVTVEGGGGGAGSGAGAGEGGGTRACDWHAAMNRRPRFGSPFGRPHTA